MRRSGVLEASVAQVRWIGKHFVELSCFCSSRPSPKLRTLWESCTVGLMEHTEWLTQTTGGDSARTVSKNSGVAGRTVLNQLDRNHFSAENVILIAEAYGKSPVRALVDTGYLDEQWAQAVDPATALRQVSEDDLADEVLRRMKLPGAHDVFETPVSELDEKRRAKETTPADTTADQSEQPETPPSVRTDEQDLEEALRDANALRGAAQHRTPRLEEPEDP